MSNAAQPAQRCPAWHPRAIRAVSAAAASPAVTSPAVDTGSRSGYTAALMSDALATSPDRSTALKHFALQMSPHDAALLREALDQALDQEPGRREAGESR